MNVALGLKAHSGWAALVAVGKRDGEAVVVERRRVELVEALTEATEACGLTLVAIPEKLLAKHAEKALGTSAGGLARKIAALGKSVGPPWGKDQKDAALAALVALQGGRKRD